MSTRVSEDLMLIHLRMDSCSFHPPSLASNINSLITTIFFALGLVAVGLLQVVTEWARYKIRRAATLETLPRSSNSDNEQVILYHEAP